MTAPSALPRTGSPANAWRVVQQRIGSRIGSVVGRIVARVRRPSSARAKPLLTIALDAPNRSPHGPYFVAGRRRLATVTAVRFLNQEWLLASHLVGRRLYLIRFDIAAGAHTVKSVIPTVFRGEEVITDLLDFDGRDLIATSNFDVNSVTLYRLTGERLAHAKDLPIADPDAGSCHGVRFVPGRDAVCAVCTNNGKQVYFISTVTGEVLYKFGDAGWRPKDVCFVDERRMVVILSDGSPTDAARGKYASKASLIAFDLDRRTHECLSEALLPACHVDCCVHADGRVWVSDQMGDCLRVCRIDGDSISFERKLSGYRFPHGVDVLPGANLLAVTNYGTSDIVITPLNA